MNWKTILWAILLVALLSWGFGPDPLDDPQACQEGTPGCLCDGVQGECRALYTPEEAEEARIQAERMEEP